MKKTTFFTALLLTAWASYASAADPIPLAIATAEYPHVESIRNGTIQIPECRISYSTFTTTILERRLDAGSAGDVIEVDLATYLERFSSEEKHDWVLVPVFLWREFPHRHVQVSSKEEIKSLEDLAGKRVGLSSSNPTLGMWARGIIESSVSIKSGYITWDQAITTSTLPRQRLITDFKTSEQNYFKNTRIFPIITALALRAELAQANPWLPEAIFIAFSEAKAKALENGTLPLPWGEKFRDETIELMQKNYWSYGVKNNPKTLATLFKYAQEQGITKTELKPEDVFAPETLQIIDDKGAKN